MTPCRRIIASRLANCDNTLSHLPFLLAPPRCLLLHPSLQPFPPSHQPNPHPRSRQLLHPSPAKQNSAMPHGCQTFNEQHICWGKICTRSRSSSLGGGSFVAWTPSPLENTKGKKKTSEGVVRRRSFDQGEKKHSGPFHRHKLEERRRGRLRRMAVDERIDSIFTVSLPIFRARSEGGELAKRGNIHIVGVVGQNAQESSLQHRAVQC